MCQLNNELHNTGDKEMTVYKLLEGVPGGGQWRCPYIPCLLIEGKQYDAGKRDIHYTKHRRLVGKGFYHCFETFEEAKRYKETSFIGSLCWIVKCTVPKNTAYYKGECSVHKEEQFTTLAVRSIIVNEKVV